MSKVHDQAPPSGEEVREWVARNGEDQDRRQSRISDEMEALAPERDRWVEAFLQRIQTRGFNVDGDQKRRITREEIPEKPDRPFKVIF